MNSFEDLAENTWKIMKWHIQDLLRFLPKYFLKPEHCSMDIEPFDYHFVLLKCIWKDISFLDTHTHTPVISNFNGILETRIFSSFFPYNFGLLLILTVRDKYF